MVKKIYTPIFTTRLCSVGFFVSALHYIFTTFIILSYSISEGTRLYTRKIYYFLWFFLSCVRIMLLYSLKAVQRTILLFGVFYFLAGLLFIFLKVVFIFQSNDNEERLQVVKLLAKMFGAKDSELASQNKPLWQCYLGRYMMF